MARATSQSVVPDLSNKLAKYLVEGTSRRAAEGNFRCFSFFCRQIAAPLLCCVRHLCVCASLSVCDKCQTSICRLPRSSARACPLAFEDENASTRKLRRPPTIVKIPRLASKERTRTWGTNAVQFNFRGNHPSTELERMC
jgi:hypothetical protein